MIHKYSLIPLKLNGHWSGKMFDLGFDVVLWFFQPGRGGLQHACFCSRALSPPRCKDQRFYEKNCERIFCKEVDPEENEPTLLMREVLFPMAKLCGNNVDRRHLVKGTSHLGPIFLFSLWEGGLAIKSTIPTPSTPLLSSSNYQHAFHQFHHYIIVICSMWYVNYCTNI